MVKKVGKAGVSEIQYEDILRLRKQVDAHYAQIEPDCAEEEASSENEEEASSENDDEGSMDEEEAVEQAVSIIASMPSREAMEDALDSIKHRVKCLIYVSEVNDMFALVLNSDQSINPFSDRELKSLQALFNSTSVVSHDVFKDNERTLAPRKDVCGASTSICFGDDVTVVMTWYWRPDNEEGFVEEFSLVQQKNVPCGDSQNSDDASETSEAFEEFVLLEGRRTLRSPMTVDINIPALQDIHILVKKAISVQSLLRFMLLCSRTECEKCQDKINSVTHGFSPVEDSEDMCHFLRKFVVEGHGPAQGKPGKSPTKAPPPKPSGRGKRAADDGNKGGRGPTKSARVQRS